MQEENKKEGRIYFLCTTAAMLFPDASRGELSQCGKGYNTINYQRLLASLVLRNFHACMLFPRTLENY